MPRKAEDTVDKEFAREKRDRDAEYKKSDRRSRKMSGEKFDRKRARQRDSERARMEEYFY